MVRTELPGVSKEDVSITVKDNLLTITGEKCQEDTDESQNYRRKENRYGSFERSFSLPPKVFTRQYKCRIHKWSFNPVNTKTRRGKIERNSN